MRNFLGGLGVAGVIAIVVLFFILGPILTVWSFGAIFPAAGVVLTFKTWLSALWLHMALGGAAASTK